MTKRKNQEYSGQYGFNLRIPQRVYKGAVSNHASRTTLRYGDCFSMPLTETETGALLKFVNQNSASEEKLFAAAAGETPEETPWPEPSAEICEKEGWAALARSPNFRLREYATRGPLDTETWALLLLDRAVTVRHHVWFNARALEQLTRSPSGRGKIAEALTDPWALAAARELLDEGKLTGFASVTLAKAVVRAAREAADAVEEKEHPEFLLDFQLTAKLVLTAPAAVEKAAAMLLEHCKEEESKLGRLMLDDPRPVVRAVYAGWQRDRYGLNGLKCATDPSAEVRRLVNEPSSFLTTEELIAFLEEDPSRVCEHLDTILERSDATELVVHYLTDPDGELHRQLIEKLNEVDEVLEAEHGMSVYENDPEEEEEEEEE